MKLTNKLIKIGLNETESVVYLDIIGNPDSTAFEIHKRTSLPKTSVYHIIENLNKRGLIDIWKKNGVSYFSSDNPKKLLNDIKEKESLIEEIIPELINLSSKSKNKDTVKFYEGEDGVKIVMRDSLYYCEKFGIKEMLTAATEEFSIKTPRFINKWVEDREKMKIFVKMLIPNESKNIPKGFETNKWRETKLLPENFNLSGIINIYGDRVDLFSIRNNKMTAVVIESQEYTTLLKSFFLIAWNR